MINTINSTYLSITVGSVYLVLIFLIFYIFKNKYWNYKKWINLLLVFLGLLLLNISFLFFYKFNLLILYPLANSIVLTYFQTILLAFGVIFWIEEKNILLLEGRYKYNLLLSFNILYIIFYIFPFAYFIDLQISDKLFSIILLLYLLSFIYFNLNKKNSFKFLIPFVLLSINFLVNVIFENKLFSLIFYNIFFFSILFSSLKKDDDRVVENSKKENEKYLVSNLSSREKEILFFILNNPEKTYNELSSQFNISEKTISTHLSNIYKKLKVKDKNDLILSFSFIVKKDLTTPLR